MKGRHIETASTRRSATAIFRGSRHPSTDITGQRTFSLMLSVVEEPALGDGRRHDVVPAVPAGALRRACADLDGVDAEAVELERSEPPGAEDAGRVSVFLMILRGRQPHFLLQ
jgi:hypothetical protein